MAQARCLVAQQPLSPPSIIPHDNEHTCDINYQSIGNQPHLTYQYTNLNIVRQHTTYPHTAAVKGCLSCDITDKTVMWKERLAQ